MVATVGTGDGEGVRTLASVEGHEGKLTRLVTVPFSVKATAHLDDIGARTAHCDHRAACATLTADATG